MLVLLTGLASAATPATRYDCVQDNPTPSATFHLRVWADPRWRHGHPLRATLVDLEARDLRIREDLPPREPAYDGYDPDGTVQFEAWDLGEDEIAGYVLQLPPGELPEVFDAQVIELFGGGRAQWVNEFTCERHVP